MSSNDIPITPVRPTRSERRPTIEDSPPLDPFATPGFPDSPLLQTPSTPPSAHRPSLSHNRKSTTSIRRKPVPRDSDEVSFELSTMTPTPDTPSPPRYVLPVDPFTPSPPSYPSAGFASSSTAHLGFREDHLEIIDGAAGGEGTGTMDELPRYAEESGTEPKTLARGLWRWGWLCPLLWGIGMCILWIPLRPVEEEQDAEKAQKLEEMIVILRETELKYARRCLYAFIGFLTMITAIVVLAVVLSRVL